MRQVKIISPTLHDIDALRKIPLSLNIRRITCDVNGTIIPDGLVPQADRKAYPFHLFGDYDKNGGFAIADNLVREKERTNLFAYYIWGVGTPLFFFNPFATINAQIKRGDLVFIYVDDLNNPTIFSFVIVSAQQGGYGSLVSQSNISQLSSDPWGVFKIFDIGYKWFDDAQLSHSLIIVNSQFDSSVSSNPMNPESYYNPHDNGETKKIVIPFEAIINQYLGISSFIAFENPVLNLTFNLYV